MKMAREYVPIFLDWDEVTEELSNEEKGRLIDAIVAYAAGKDWSGIVHGNERFLFPAFRRQIDRSNEISEQRARAGSKPKQTETNRNKPKQNGTKRAKANEEDKEEDKDKEEDNKNTISAETSSAPAFRLPLIDGTFHGITEAEAAHLQSLYPAVSVSQELRKMIGWLEANPKNRKTAAGINRFINSWLSRQQDRAPRQQGKPSINYGGNDAYGGDL